MVLILTLTLATSYPGFNRDTYHKQTDSSSVLPVLRPLLVVGERTSSRLAYCRLLRTVRNTRRSISAFCAREIFVTLLSNYYLS
jgi:hypothetical protein